MQQTMTLRGVPDSIARDAWWLESDTGGAPAGPRADGPGHLPGRKGRLWGLALIVLLADLLFWHHDPGLSVPLFAAAVFGLATWRVGAGKCRLARPLLLFLIGALPAVEHLQALSLGFLAAGLLAANAWAHHPQAGAGAVLRAATGFLARYPALSLAPLRRLAMPSTLRALSGTGAPTGVARRLARSWGVPLGGSLVFSSLVLDANPVLQNMIRLDIDGWELAMRGLFWLGVAFLLGPIAAPDLPPPAARASARRMPVPFGVNAASVLRALVAFNLVIGIQMATDASILIGGAALPEGITYAEYAHRGAYPLLATALLAGLFALAARPFLGEHRMIRPLMLLWLGQNIALCGAAALRLDLYVAAYGLTYLRIYAFIWMALVAAGLSLTAWQALRDLGTRWLLLRAGAVGLATLYTCAFVNFAQIIAERNLTRDRIDTWYLCNLGPMASAPLIGAGIAGTVPHPCPALEVPKAGDWREWGFRTWRVRRYAQAAEAGRSDE